MSLLYIAKAKLHVNVMQDGHVSRLTSLAALLVLASSPPNPLTSALGNIVVRLMNKIA